MQPTCFIERNRCPVCDGSDAERLFDAPYDDGPIRAFLDAFYPPPGGVDHGALAGGRYVLDACRGCGLVFQRHVLDGPTTHALYESWIDPMAARAQADSSRERVFAYAAEMLTLLHAFDRPPSRIRVLDFGMGFGAYCRMARGFGFTVAGVELSDTRVEAARADGIVVLRWHEVPTRRFDFLHAEQVFEHLAEPVTALRHLVASLEPGGYVKLGVPDGRGIRERLAQPDFAAPKNHPRSLNAVSPLEHVNCFTPATLEALARSAGLEPAAFPLSVELPSAVGDRPARALLATLARPLRRALGRATTTQLFRKVAPR